MKRFVRKRYIEALSVIPSVKLQLCTALREAFRENYGRQDFRSDLLAGIVVGIVALPLSMALAIATGVPPQHGLYTAIIAGFVTALLGGSRTQVSGPTAAFVVILVPIVGKFGLGGLLVATMMAGVMLLLLGIFRMGKLIEFIPYPVTMGFTAGIAVVIATFQLKDFLGLTIPTMPDHFVEKIAALVQAIPTVHWPDLAVGVLTLGLLLLFPKFTRRVPAPLVALVMAMIAGVVFHRLIGGFDIDTIGSRFSFMVNGVKHQGIPNLPPIPSFPWSLPGDGGQPMVLSWNLLQDLMPSAFAIAMLGAIESLLSAVVADGMAGTKHNPDGELVAQGAANIISPFFGGFASTGAIARTATNIRAGAKSPISAIVHALFVMLAVLVLAPLLAHLPMSALAALLMVVAWNMSEAKHFLRVARVAPKSDSLVLMACFFLTVFFDMVVAVSVGMVLAAMLFMRRMAEISGSRLIEEHPSIHREPLPPGVILYEIAGPLFFGAAQKAMSAIASFTKTANVMIIDMEAVPMMDATGLVNLESTLERLQEERIFVILTGVQAQPLVLMAKFGIEGDEETMEFAPTLETAITMARIHLQRRISGDLLKMMTKSPNPPTPDGVK